LKVFVDSVGLWFGVREERMGKGRGEEGAGKSMAVREKEKRREDKQFKTIVCSSFPSLSVPLFSYVLF